MSKETSRIDDSEYAHLEDVLANSGSPGERMEAHILLEQADLHQMAESPQNDGKKIETLTEKIRSMFR